MSSDREGRSEDRQRVGDGAAGEEVRATEEAAEGSPAGVSSPDGASRSEAAGEPAESEAGQPAGAEQPPVAVMPGGGDPSAPAGEAEGAGPPLVGERLARARALVNEGRVREAVELYTEIVSDHPQSLKARNNLGVLYDEMGQHGRALEQFEAARILEPENVEVLYNLGAALVSLTRFDEAERELRRALKLQPDNVEVRAHLGILYFRRGLYVHAEQELRWVCERDYDHGPAHYYRGEALNRLGKVDAAIEVLERAARLQPGNSKIFHTMGIIFDKKHMPVEAAQMYRKARELTR